MDKFNRYTVPMKKVVLALLLTFLAVSPVFAVTAAPHITDREIIEGLTNIRGDIKRLEAGQASIEKRFDDVNKRIDDLKESTNKRFDDVNKRFDDLNNSVNKRFDILQWMFGLFITAAMVILGFVLNMQWQMQKKQTQMETSLEAQKAELTFVKNLIEKLQTLIEKLIPPRGVL